MRFTRTWRRRGRSRAVKSTVLRSSAGWIAAAVVFLSEAVSGCGYSIGYRETPGVRTVAVPTFHNATFPIRREIEYEITSAFRQELQARTSLRIIDELASPDMVVRGRILEFRERVVAEGKQDQKTESSLVALVELQIENYKGGTLRVERVSDVEPFSIQAGESFDDGRRRAIRNLAEKLVIAAEDWSGGEPLPEEGGAQGGEAPKAEGPDKKVEAEAPPGR